MTATRSAPVLPDLKHLWAFARPHTIIGTSLSVWALAVMALARDPQWPSMVQIAVMLGTWLACLSGNLYIVGLNQLTDIEIDRINKPHLPLASGAFTPEQGKQIVMVSGAIAIALGLLLGPCLLATVLSSVLLGTLYSLPPVRLKRWPILAAFCILVVRGVVINGGLYLHFTQRLTGQSEITSAVGVLIAFIVLFSIAIALFKDMPDTSGDREYNILTFTLLLGKEAVFQIVRGVLIACYVGMIGVGVYHLADLNPTVMIGGHSLLLGALWWRSQSVELEEEVAIAAFYQFIWRLFFLEYLVFPLTCWPWS